MRGILLPVLVLFIVLGLGLGVRKVFAAGSHEGVINTKEGVAIHGYDPVAYFTQGRPVQGSPEYSYAWAEAEWHFANQAHRDLFAEDPERYAPQYGGYCAWAVSNRSLADIDPNAWHIEDGRLFLNYNNRLNRRFVSDLPARIQQADENWPTIQERLAE